jgi:hypothetical protein
VVVILCEHLFWVFSPVLFLSFSILIVATLCASYTFIGVGRTQEYPEKPTDLPQLIDKLYHMCCHLRNVSLICYHQTLFFFSQLVACMRGNITALVQR